MTAKNISKEFSLSESSEHTRFWGCSTSRKRSLRACLLALARGKSVLAGSRASKKWVEPKYPALHDPLVKKVVDTLQISCSIDKPIEVTLTFVPDATEQEVDLVRHTLRQAGFDVC